MFRYIINFFRPKTVEQAALNKLRLSLVYAFFGWNAFIIVFYKVVTRDLPSDPVDRRNVIISKLHPTGNIKITRFNGLTVEREVINAEDFKEQVRLKESMRE